MTYILSATRTPIGSFGGIFSTTSVVTLGEKVVKNALEKANVDSEKIEELYMGLVCSANTGQAPARQVALAAGLPSSTVCTTINKVCASGMKSITLGSQSIELQQNNVVVAGGMENMSAVPFYIPKARFGYSYGHSELVDGLAKDGLMDAYQSKAMGCFADATAKKYALSREKQDEFAINSYKKAALAWEKGFFTSEITPVEITHKKTTLKIQEDEEFKKVDFEKIPLLKPAFTPDGTVTAANASSINDGAAALVLASEAFVKNNNSKPLARIIAYADAEQSPEWFTTSPVLATEKALKRANLTINDIDFFEVNEAFAGVALVYQKLLNIPSEKLNSWGGAVALGHPLGCSGARIVVTLLSILRHNKARYGLAAVCNGGGGASAIIVEYLI